MSTIKAIIAEAIIPLGKHKTIFSSERIHIRVGDEAVGPYLLISGVCDEPIDNQKAHEFALCSHKEIDEFCMILHNILKGAEDSGK